MNSAHAPLHVLSTNSWRQHSQPGSTVPGPAPWLVRALSIPERPWAPSSSHHVEQPRSCCSLKNVDSVYEHHYPQSRIKVNSIAGWQMLNNKPKTNLEGRKINAYGTWINISAYNAPGREAVQNLWMFNRLYVFLWREKCQISFSVISIMSLAAPYFYLSKPKMYFGLGPRSYQL